MKFKNPDNNYIEEVSVIVWFWLLLFGPFYFAFKGIWGHAVGSAILVVLTGGIAWLIYPFFAKSIIRKHYLRHGWIEIENDLNEENKESKVNLGSGRSFLTLFYGRIAF